MLGIIKVIANQKIQYYFASVTIADDRFLLIDSCNPHLKPFKKQIDLSEVMSSIQVTFIGPIKILAFTLEDIQYLFTDSCEALATYIEKGAERIKKDALS